MKPLTILLAIAITLTISCKRSAAPQNGMYPLQGKWKYTEYFMDPGNGSGTWQPAPQGQASIEFRADGTLASDAGIFSNYTRYEVQNSSSMVLTAPPSNNTFSLRFTITGSTLELNPQCFEGCGFRFIRQ
jgi:hypothetical protein